MTEKVWVVCDANGICQGVFIEESLARLVAEQTTAYVSEHSVIESYQHYYNKQYTEQVVGEE